MDTETNWCEQVNKGQIENTNYGLPEQSKNLKRKAQHAPDTTQAQASKREQSLPSFAETFKAFLQNPNDKWQETEDTTAFAQGTIPTPDSSGREALPQDTFANWS